MPVPTTTYVITVTEPGLGLCHETCATLAEARESASRFHADARIDAYDSDGGRCYIETVQNVEYIEWGAPFTRLVCDTKGARLEGDLYDGSVIIAQQGRHIPSWDTTEPVNVWREIDGERVPGSTAFIPGRTFADMIDHD